MSSLGIGLRLFESRHKALVPALNTLGLARQLAVEHHLSLAASEYIGGELCRECAVHTDEPLQTILLVGACDAPEHDLVVVRADRAEQRAGEGAAATTEGGPKAHELCVAVVGTVPVGFEQGHIFWAGHVELAVVSQGTSPGLGLRGPAM